MTAPNTHKITQYKAQITKYFSNQKTLTPAQFSQAVASDAIKMLEAESGGNGSVNTTLATYVGWVQNNPLAMKFFTTASTAESDFQNVINGGIATLTTGADILPSTYIALHAENTANEPKLAGLLALRNQGVDSTYKDDGANLGAGTAGNVLSDAYVMGLYGTWGAAKFNAIMNDGVLKSIVNESNALYDTLAEVSAVYDAWANTVSVSKFFNAINTMVTAGVSGLKFSDMMTLANNQTNFDKYTAAASVKLMASTGGTFAGVTGLSGAEFTALTSANAVNAIENGNANFTLLHTVYGASVMKLTALLSNDSVNLATKGYSGIDISTLSTAYGTTYTLAANTKYNTIVSSENYPLFASGITYATLATAYDNAKLHSITPDILNVLVQNDPASVDTNAAVLVGTPANFGGLEVIPFE